MALAYMINPNELFNFIDQIILTSEANEIDNCKAINKTTSINEEIYIRIDLKRDKNSLIIDDDTSYLLQDHHISFYEMPKNGQYHYTAYFLDKELKRYQLHVYFDEQDELIECAPVEFAKYNDETETYQTLASERLNEQFITLANNKIAPIICKIREKHTKEVERLEQEYQVNERQSSLLSKENHHKNYLESLENTLATLERLVALGGQSYYQSAKKLIEGSISYIKEQQNSAAASVSKKKKKQIKKEEEPNVLNTKTPASDVSNPNQKKTTSSSDDKKLEVNISKLMKLLQTLNQITPEKQVLLIKNIFSIVNQWILTNEQKELCQKINELYGLTYFKGGSLLCDLIVEDKVKNRFQLAAQLEPFHEGLNSKLLSMALDAGDCELLDFILTYKKFYINALSFEIDDGFYPSAVHFCYQIDDESMISCLSVLIKHGASVFVKDEQGLPIAYRILSEPNHPLQKAFEENKELTLKSASFYQKLIKSLQSCLNLKNLGETEKQKLATAIELYKQELKNINSATQLPRSQLTLFALPLNKTDIDSEQPEEQNKNILK